MSNKTQWDKILNNINGTWKSVISVQKYNFNISYSNKRPSGFVENMTIDNIQGAEDVLVRE